MLGNEPEILDSKFEDDTTLIVFEQTKKSEKQGSRP